MIKTWYNCVFVAQYLMFVESVTYKTNEEAFRYELSVAKSPYFAWSIQRHDGVITVRWSVKNVVFWVGGVINLMVFCATIGLGLFDLISLLNSAPSLENLWRAILIATGCVLMSRIVVYVFRPRVSLVRTIAPPTDG